ncbi:exodeoxyribonuclease V subunit beta [Neisseria chenwenguii]|uniref:exodeoxyribonuclease V subunit beta n=1 Tax=Neisseria chenwenguii TaxID=1853278 RepID=UPI000F5009C7|nr:exodeoxyribonuclease V subunit beta [Neisseria chenwenguii]ROV57401.1 exodeoxyribonuclease V subunit beta [Neisseria chenwenguii]
MTASAQPFRPLTAPIDGTNLIEASAGTGKTYGIAALFARLIVLEQINVESVLVVTFTKAATAELKTRLRARLDDVLQALESMEDAEDSDGLDEYCAANHRGDEFLPELLRAALQRESRARLIVRLKAAVGDFDNAAVYTIHGFCQRVLRDYAFLCRAPFDVELADESRGRLLIPAQDFWRERIVNDPTLAELVFQKRLTPQKMLDTLKSYVGRPYLTFRRPETDLAETRAAVTEKWEKVRGKLDKLEETFWRIFPTLNGNSYRKTTFTALFAKLKTAAENGALPEFDDKMNMLAADELEGRLKKGQTPDAAAFADLQTVADLGRDLEAADKAAEDARIRLHLDLLDYLNAAVEEAKKSRRERNFDDLLLDVHRALTDNPHGTALAEAVAQNWRVALIDEFQDTDPLQYEIFSRIFAAQNRALFLVGDPKQAIYSFRGADIYAYLQAAKDAARHYTLDVNYRSHAKLINGIGALFQQKNRPFVLPDITYGKVGAARETGRLKPARPAVQVRWLHESDVDLPAKDALRRRAAEYCADEIAFALAEAASGRLNFKDAPLRSDDIAVLVRTKNEGRLVADALKTRRIQSVMLHSESVFAEQEAAALAALLQFWLEPRDTEPLRFALTGVLFRYDAGALFALNRDEAALLAWSDSAAQAAREWQWHGFYAAMQNFAARHGIETRLLSDGNTRSLTNYSQLLELLAEEDAQSHSPQALLQWLNAQIAEAQNGSVAENKTLRLESDEALVKIVTMHASKGLQYPLVYCPFAWDASGLSEEWAVVHNPNGQTELLAKAQLTGDDQARQADEDLAERLRLLYVALTRAEEQLNIYAACCNDTPANTFAYLLEGSRDADRAAVQEAYQSERNNAEKGQRDQAATAMLKRNWLRFIENAPADTEFAFIEGEPPAAAVAAASDAPPRLAAAEIPERTFESVRHTSFTGLSRFAKNADSGHEALQPSLEPAETAVMLSENPSVPSENEADIHHFPRGANAGVCLHEMLEKLDFNRPAAEQQAQTAEILARYGFEEKWLPAVNALLDTCRQTPLAGGASLADVPAAARLPEMGFTLYTEDFKLGELQKWFRRPDAGLPPECAEAAGMLDFQDVKGFLNGFIDMIFQTSDGLVCIIDYKSNHLGNDTLAYTQQAMNEAVAHHHYYLQALIYAVAVARYFRERRQPLPKIAVRYLFLRGLDGSENGIWQWDVETEDLARWL